jgi:hypothetical protein
VYNKTYGYGNVYFLYTIENRGNSIIIQVFFDPEKECGKRAVGEKDQRIREELAREEGKTIETHHNPAIRLRRGFSVADPLPEKEKEKEKEGKKPFYSSNFTILLLIIILKVIFYFVFLR